MSSLLVFNSVYRLEIQSVMLVLSTQPLGQLRGHAEVIKVYVENLPHIYSTCVDLYGNRTHGSVEGELPSQVLSSTVRLT
jgi:hypothetical protein